MFADLFYLTKRFDIINWDISKTNQGLVNYVSPNFVTLMMLPCALPPRDHGCFFQSLRKFQPHSELKQQILHQPIPPYNEY